MKIRSILLFIFCVLNLNAKSFAHFNQNPVQTPDSLGMESLTVKTVFRFDNGNFSGKGWDILMDNIQKAQFVLIGEQHGEAEIPIFTGKVAEKFKPKALVAEIDPYTATQLKKISVNPTGYSAYFKQNPYDFAFYSWETEMALARQMQLSHIDIWGLNEINFLSMGRFFNTLSSLTKSPGNKKKTLEMGLKYAKYDRPFYGDANRYGDFIAYKIKMSTIDSLLYDFRNESSLSKKMLKDLKTGILVFSNENYLTRLNLMKRNLLNYLSPYISKDSINIPKLLFKFGANHVPRTDDLTGYFEVGNLADNLAAASDKKTLHILIFGKKGTINAMAPLNNDVAIKPYDVTEDGDLSMFKSLTDLVEDDEWALYDLRPIRRALVGGCFHTDNNELKGFIMGYDLLVIYGKVTGNKFID